MNNRIEFQKKSFSCIETQEQKRRMRDRLIRDTEIYLKNGGKVSVVAPSGDGLSDDDDCGGAVEAD